MAGRNPSDRDDLAGMVNLMAHPMAGMAAASAIGVGMAAQMVGAWIGAVEGSLEASRRIMGTVPRSVDLPVSEATRRDAAKATDALIAEARAKVVSLATRKRERAENAARMAARPAAAKEPTPKPATPKPASAAVVADDLKVIGGIGPKLEQALNRMGLNSFAQLAALSDAEAAKIEAQMGFPGRIARDGWVEQARRLAAAQTKA